MRMERINIVKLITVVSILIALDSCRGTIQQGEGGKIKSGTVYPQCDEPQKTYATALDAKVKLTLIGDGKQDYNTFSAGLTDKVIRLGEHSQTGMDIDLILFRLCEISLNRGFTSEQTSSLMDKTIDAWLELSKTRAKARAVEETAQEGVIRLSKELGIAESAVENFLRILEQGKIPKQDWDRKLREIAVSHKKLQADMSLLQSDDQQVRDLIHQAKAAIKQGQYAQAEQLIGKATQLDLKAAKAMQQKAEKRFLSAAASFHQNGELQLLQIRYQAAEDYFRQAVETVPQNHPLVHAKYLKSWGDAARGNGHYQISIDALEKCLQIREKHLSETDSDLSATLNNLALSYAHQGHYTKAEPLILRAIQIKEKSLGSGHSSLATSLNNLAGLYESQGHYAKAEPLYLRAIQINEKSLGSEHPELAKNLNNLANLYRSQGYYAKAEPLYLRAIQIMEKSLGSDHPSLATSLNNLADLYRTQVHYAKAEPLYLRAIQIREKSLGSDHPNLATSLNDLANLYQSQGHYAKAEPLYLRVIGIYEKSLGSVHPWLATSLNNLAELYRTQGHYAKAEPLYLRSIQINEKSLGSDHPSLAMSFNNIGVLYFNQKKFETALPFLEKALGIQEQKLPSNHPNIITSHENIGYLQLQLKNPSKALYHFETALKLKKTRLGANDKGVKQLEQTVLMLKTLSKASRGNTTSTR